MDAPSPPDGAQSSGTSGPNGPRSGSAGGSGAGRSGNRNRNRNRSKSGSGGGNGSQARAGNRGNGSGGGNRNGGGGGNRNRSGGGQGRSSSANRSGGSPGRRPNSGGRPQNRSEVERPAPVAVPTIDRSAESTEEAATVRSNRRRAVRITVVPGLIIGVVVGVILIVSGLPGYLGAVGLVVVAVGLSLWLWQRAPGAVLRAVGAQPSREEDRPRLHNLVEGLCATMGLPQPAIAVIDSPVPNAMAVGRDPSTATLVVTSALDKYLDLVELEGVLAHELVHVKRHDTVVAAVAVVVNAPWSVLVGVPRATERVHALLGPGREFSADQRAAAVVRYPPGVGSALEAMVEGADPAHRWSPGTGRTAALTRWLWIDPMVGVEPAPSPEGNLDDTRVRAAALALR